MSKHNYTQYSNKNHNNSNNQHAVEDAKTPEVAPVAESTPVATPEVKLVNETVETKVLPETVSGMVVGCAKLNVRAEASLFADIVCVLNAQSEIEIDVNKSNKDWFYICTATGIEGYCMRKFVEAHL